MEKFIFDGREYGISEYVETNCMGTVAVIAIPMMSDYKWQQMALKSRLEHPERYAQFENVDAAISELQTWLSNASKASQ